MDPLKKIKIKKIKTISIKKKKQFRLYYKAAVVLAQKQTHKYIEQYRDSRNKFICI